MAFGKKPAADSESKPVAPPAAKPVPNKATAKLESEPAPAQPLPPKGAKPSLFIKLAEQLSQLGGLTKGDEVIREPTPVLIAGRADGGITLKLPGIISTRCATLDAAIGRGGVPMSRLTVIAGGEAGGKTTMALHLCAEVQSMGGVAIYIDNEHKIDLDYAKALGVDLTRLLITQPGTIEESLSVLNETVKMVQAEDPNIPVLGILDSINASKSIKEYEDDGSANFEESNQAGLGATARVMSDKLPKMMRAISNKKVALFFISQPRDNIGGYGGQNLVAGGNAVKFYMALGIQLIRKGFWEESGKKIGSQMMAKVFKNQVASPMKEAEFNIRWGAGIDFHHSLIARGSQLGLISPGANGWFEMADPANEGQTLKWQGSRGWHKITLNRPDIVEFIKQQNRISLGLESPPK